MTNGKISVDELQRMLLDPNMPDEVLRPYLELDPLTTKAFEPQVRPRLDRITEPAVESALLLNTLNGAARWRRERRYRRRIAEGWTGPRIVSEGDSWFQYPFLLTDVIDWLDAAYAILSLDAAGDLLGDILKQDEVAGAITAESARVLLISGGGNDMIGGGRLSEYLREHQPSMDATQHLNERFEPFLAGVIDLYRRLFERLTGRFPDLAILCHGYDRAIPATDGRWLGRPMREKGIVDIELQRAIIRVIIDRFNEALADLVGGFGSKVRYVDCRGAVGDTWYDELHPTDQGFQAVSLRFRTVIDEALAALA